jgi:hypothetical protein
MRLPWQRKEGSDSGEIEFPDDLKTKIEAGATAATELKEVKEKLSGLDKITEFIDTFKSEEAKKKAAAVAAANNEHKEGRAAKIEELMLEGKTQEAIALATQDKDVAILTLNASNVKREVFENEKDFEYYHGDIKTEVDKLIAGQTLAARNDRSVIENCYHTVVGKHSKEILEGKIKNRWAASDSAGRSTRTGAAGPSESDSEMPFDSLAQKDEIAKAAKILGYNSDEYRKMLDKEGVGYA